MSLRDHPKEYSPEALSIFEAVYRDIHRLYARMSRTEEATEELEVALSRALAALVTDGVTEPKELRRKAFEAVVLNPR